MEMFETFEMRKGADVVIVNRHQEAQFREQGYTRAGEEPAPAEPPPPAEDEAAGEGEPAKPDAPPAAAPARRRTKKTGEEAPGA